MGVKHSANDDPSRLTRQLSLALPPPKKSWGGARRGAGRPRVKDDDRGFIAHRARPSHRKGDPVHVTLRVGRGIPSLRSQALERLVQRALRKQRAKLEAKHEAESEGQTGTLRFQIVHFTIQTDHLHLIVEAPDKRALARGVAGLEIRVARAINGYLGRKGGVWSERYHRRDLRTPTEVRNALRYVLLNGQKHHRVIGDRNFADPCSSAATFDGFTRRPATLRTLEKEEPWLRVTPRTWLLAVGWRRHGLIDPTEPPGRSLTRS